MIVDELNVALLTESVDRNNELASHAERPASQVALLTESVDRNRAAVKRTEEPEVALLTESVDRNIPSLYREGLAQLSLSSRRAWIEIQMGHKLKGDELRRSPHGERG